MRDIYPLTIIADRFQGTYSRGKYLAFNVKFFDLPKEILAGDVPNDKFFSETKLIIGKGKTPAQAVKDLSKKLPPNKNDKLKDKIIKDLIKKGKI